MKTRFYFNGVQIKKEEKGYIRGKIDKIQKYFEKPAILGEIEIEINKRGDYRVELQFKGPGFQFIGEEEADTVQAAFDLVFDELVQQAREEKKKHRTIAKRKAISLKKNISINKGARFKL